MSGKYNAFISYNHNPRDSKIALMLQQRLERFKLPRGIEGTDPERGISGRIERVFLDTGELEVSGDLNEIIQNALSNSEKLIVICSPEGKASIWVQREIEFFLQSHTHRDILTVLTEGEPQDVIPEALLYEEVTGENGETVRVSREPLSADYRLPLRKANAQELPRLAAALLGCRYDDLVQRQRAYKMKRQIAITAAAAVVLLSSTAYLIWSNHQISTNFEKSLYEQALRLASQSEQSLSRGDRVGAVKYALEALPSSDNKKQPVIPEAVKALADALGVYTSSESGFYTAVRNYGETRSWSEIDTAVIDDTVYLARLSLGGKVEVWNADTGQAIMSEYLEEYLTSENLDATHIRFTDSGKLILMTYRNMVIIDPIAEKAVHRIDFAKVDGIEDPFVFDVPVIRGEDVWLTVSDGDDKSHIVKVDAKTGKVGASFDTNDSPGTLVFSSDDRYMAYFATNKSESENAEAGYVFKVLDSETGKEVSSGTRAFITDVQFSRNDDLIICGLSERPDDEAWSNQYVNKGFYYGMEHNVSVKDERTVVISGVDPKSGESLWDIEHTSFSNGSPYIAAGTGAFSDHIYCSTGANTLVIDDAGKIVKDFELESAVLAFIQEKDEPDLENIRMLLANGDMAIYMPDNDSLYISKGVFMGDIVGGCFTKAKDTWNIFLLTDTTKNSSAELQTLTHYSGKTGDPQLKNFTHDGDETWENYKYKTLAVEPYGKYFLAVLYANEYSVDGSSRTTHLVMTDSEDGSILFAKDILTEAENGKDGYQLQYKYCGLDKDAGKAYWLNFEGEDSPSLLSVDLKDGSDKVIPLTITENGSSVESGKVQFDFPASVADNFHLAECSIDDGKINCEVYTTVNDKTSAKYLVIDPDSGKGELSTDNMVGGSPRCLDAGRDKVVTIREKMQCFDYSSGKELWASDETSHSEARALAISEDGMVAEAEEGIDTETGETMSSTIRFFDIDKGRKKGELKLDFIPDDIEFMQLHDVSDDEYLLTFPELGYLIDKKNFQIRSVIDGTYISYNPETRLFLLGDYNTGTVGVAPYRSLDDLIKEGNELIN